MSKTFKIFKSNFSPLLWIRQNSGDIVSYLGLVLCISVFSVTSGGRLWSPYNIGLILESTSVYAMIALGAMFIYSMGYMDVSVGPQLGVYAIIMILIINATGSLLLGFAVILVIALIAGFMNGYVAVWLGVPSIVTSLFLMFIFSGVQILLMERTGVNTISANFNFEAFLRPEVIFTVLAVEILIVGYLFNYTKLGKYVKAIGANEVTASHCGVNTTFWKVVAYLAFGFTVALGAVFLLARTGSAGKGTGSGYAMDIMLALILGGMPLSGGMTSRLRSAVTGAFTYVLLSNGLTLSGVDVTVIHMIKAVIFVGVTLLTCRKKYGVLPR